MKKSFLFILVFLLCFLLAACTSENSVTAGTEKYRDFLIDNVFYSVLEGDIHYNVYIPETYDSTKPYALYFTLPGYGGLYFQGAAANIKTEEFGFEAMKYNEEMIIVAPQLNDLIPAVESKYSTYAESTDSEGLSASRDHRGFGGFSMGSVNTWCTFRYALDYFRYFLPMSGSYTADGEYMAELVKQSGHEWDDFFIFSATGTDDFAYSAFKAQIMAMGNVTDGTFDLPTMRAKGTSPIWNGTK